MKQLAFLLLAILVTNSCGRQEDLHFAVHAGERDYWNCPVAVDLELFNPVPDLFRLYEVKEEGKVEVPFQYDNSSSNLQFWIIVEGSLSKGETRKYLLTPTRKQRKKAIQDLHFLQDEDELTISESGQAVVTYRKSEINPPEGVDTLFRRSGYLHPLRSPGGETLTRIQPPDHYHHYGIWNPWTLTHIRGREIDYWNLGKGEGTVRSVAILMATSGPVQAAFTALHEHIDLGAEEGERTAMDEFWDVRYWSREKSRNRYALDLYTTLRNVLTDTIIFDAYRYGGGIGFRATEKWNAGSCTVLTSEDYKRDSADGTKARWCIIEGISGSEQGRSGILFLSHPDNREHPEPMRVWPVDSNNGELFFEFCPIRHNSWIIEPGKDYTLKYRMIVFDGAIAPEEAEMYWNGFAYPPEVALE